MSDNSPTKTVPHQVDPATPTPTDTPANPLDIAGLRIDPSKLAAAAEKQQLDAEEAEFRALRRDLPGVKGSSAAGIVAISVGKAPQKNAFFRTHSDFEAIVSIVNVEVGMEKTFFAVTDEMVKALAGIGITVSDHRLYLTLTSEGALRVVPVRCANADGQRGASVVRPTFGARAPAERSNVIVLERYRREQRNGHE